MDKKFFSEFASPPSKYRGKPFWAWNGTLDQDELRRQVRLFHRMGLGGFFMHSRVGLNTPYLSDEWFDCVRACIDEARKLKMEAWMYDEDRWSSGAAGGLVTKNPKYRMRSLVMDRLDDPKRIKWTDDVLAVFTANVDGTAASDVQQLERGKRPRALESGRSVLVFRVKLQDTSPWYNSQTYLDTLNHRAVKEFIKVTHQAYEREVGRDFGKLVPGIFTDEPNYGGGPDTHLPWTDGLPATFRKRYRYNLLDHLPELFFDVDGRQVSRARYHFYDCVTFLFTDAFARLIGEWCDANGVQSTGHVLSEDSLSSQTGSVGNAMRFYEHMQAPGIDILTEHWRAYNTAKQCTSVARQFGRTWRLSETNGCTGWDWSFEAHKAIGDWQAACGINLRCPHLSFYTMLAEAKRDYPASIFYQSPWWELYDTVEGYFARVNAAMTRGREVRDLLVIHPIESMWLLRRMGWHADERVHRLDQMLDSLVNTLLSNHIDFDYGDEELMSRHARVSASGGNALLKLGKATYKAVLVPPMTTMRASTLDLLKRFAAKGCTVVFAGDPAAYVDAEPSGAVAEFAGQCTTVGGINDEMIDILAPLCRRVSITDAAGRELPEVIYLLREDAKAYYLFVANTSHVPESWNKDPLVRDRKASYPDVRIRGFARCEGRPIELDPTTGSTFLADAAKDGTWEIRTDLPRIGSRLFVIPKATGAEAPPRPPKLADLRTQPLNPDRWEISLSENNALVLDRPCYRIGKGEWQAETEILRVDAAVRDALGTPRRGGAMVQPWAREKPAKPRSLPVALRYSFGTDYLPTGELYLAIERPEYFRILLNGQEISSDAECGWWVDKSLRKVPIDPALIRIGRNELLLECNFDETFSGFEIAYLLGHFGSRVSGMDVHMTAPPETLALGDWCGQGLAFYGGSVTYRTRISSPAEPGRRVVVRLGEWRGVAVRVLLDGAPLGVIAWEPCELDITDALAAAGGEGELGLEVIGHRRNSHGPLHLTEKWPEWTGPAEFVQRGDRWFEGYQLVPVGLMTPPELVVKG